MYLKNKTCVSRYRSSIRFDLGSEKSYFTTCTACTINEVETSVTVWKDRSYWLQPSAQVGPLSPEKKLDPPFFSIGPHSFPSQLSGPVSQWIVARQETSLFCLFPFVFCQDAELIISLNLWQQCCSVFIVFQLLYLLFTFFSLFRMSVFDIFSASLNFIRLLRVVITPWEEKTTRSNRMNFRLLFSTCFQAYKVWKVATPVRSKLKAQKQFGIVMAKRRKKKHNSNNKSPIFFIWNSRVFVGGLSHPRRKKISNYGAQNQTNHSSISYCFVLFVILVIIIIFILIDFFWFSNFGARRCKFEHFR